LVAQRASAKHARKVAAAEAEKAAAVAPEPEGLKFRSLEEKFLADAAQIDG
jgi:hypothetical protein